MGQLIILLRSILFLLTAIQIFKSCSAALRPCNICINMGMPAPPAPQVLLILPATDAAKSPRATILCLVILQRVMKQKHQDANPS